MKRLIAIIILPGFILAGNLSGKTPQTAVFNFGMAEGGSEWKWLEKGLADMLTNDLLSARYPVVARDEMQAVAMRSGWDRMTELSERMGRAPLMEIHEAIKIERLISGSYAVRNGHIEIEMQVVNPDNGRLLKKIHTSGPVDNVLSIRQELSRKLVPWLNKASADGDPTLLYEVTSAPWSESIDAMRALYQGIDLFDQGAYQDAWLKFRQAEKTSPRFADAHYWAARMDYFQARYDHSRHQFENFLHRYPDHPLVGPAVREYMHSWENTTADTEQILALYEHMAAAYPHAPQHIGSSIYPNHKWARWRAMQLLGKQNEYEKALELGTPTDTRPFYWWNPGERRRLNYLFEHFENGSYNQPIIDEAKEHQSYIKLLQYEPGETTIVTEGHPYRHQRAYRRYYLIAPKGKLFDTMKIWPMSNKGHHSRVRATVSQRRWYDVHTTSFKALHSFSDEEYLEIPTFAQSPGAYFYIYLWSGNAPLDEPGTSIDGAKFEASFKDIPDTWGSLDITCRNSLDFRVWQGDDLLRSGPGKICYLAPGKHTLRFQPGSYRPVDEHVEFEQEVIVRANETTQIEVKFPWKQPDKWHGWYAGEIEPSDSQTIDLDLRNSSSHRPQFIMTDDKIRLVWSQSGDLWTCESDDGKRFYNQRKLDLPISSAWLETDAQCEIDPQGRYVLTFLSNRSDDRVMRLYAAWSRDFRSWTAPRRIRDDYVARYGLCVDPKTGKLVIAENAGDNHIHLWTSTDSVTWQTRASIEFDDSILSLNLLPPNTAGEYEIFATMKGEVHKKKPGVIAVYSAPRHITRWLSNDLASWRRDEAFDEVCKGVTASYLVATRGPHDETALVNFTPNSNGGGNRATFFKFAPSGGAVNKYHHGATFATYDSTLSHHPRWGAYFCWFSVTTIHIDPRPFGPIIVGGPDWSPFFSPPSSGI